MCSLLLAPPSMPHDEPRRIAKEGLFTGARGRRILVTPYTEPCITHPYRTGVGRYSPVQVPNLIRHMLWRYIKMRDLACGHCGFTTVDMMVLWIVEIRGGGHRGT